MELTGEPGDSLSQQCSNCDCTSAACWCLDCNEALCSICVSAHRRVTVTRSHRLLHHSPEGNILSSPTKFCRLHPSEPLKLICFTCKQLTCRDCQLTTHMNHRYQFVSETVVSLKKQLDIYAHSIKRQEDTVRQSLQDMETRLQLIDKSESRLRTLLQERFISFAKFLKANMIALHKDMQKVHELECQQIQGRMVKLKQLQQSQISVKETLEKARTLSDLPSLLTHTVQIKSELKNLLDQDSEPPLKMPEVEVITKKGYQETLSELCKLHVSWIPFSVPPTSDKNTETPAVPAVPPPTSTCNPISSTVMDSTSGSPSLNPSITSSSAQFSPSASQPRRDSISSMISSSPQTESPSCSASPVSNDCVATPSPTSSPSSNSVSAFNKFSSNLTLYNLLTKDHVDTHHPVNPQSASSSSQSGQLSHALPPTSTSPLMEPLLPSCSSSGIPASRASPSCTHLSSHQHFPSSHSSNSSFSTSITSPAHISTFPQHTDPITQTGKTLNCNTPVTISALPSQSVYLSDQMSMLPSSTTPRFPYPSPITHSTSTQPVPTGPIKTGTTSDVPTPVTMTTFSSLSAYFSSQLKLPISSTSSSPVFTGSIAQTGTSSDISTPVTINSLTSPSAHLTNQLSIHPSSVSSVFSSLSTTLSTSLQTLNTSVTKTVVPDSSNSHPSVWLLSYNESNLPLSSSICPSSVAPLPISSTHLAPYSELPPKTANTRRAGAPVQINSFSTSLLASPNQFKPLVSPPAVVLACSTTTSSTMPPKFTSTCPVSSCSPLLQPGNFSNTNLLFPVNTSSSTSGPTTPSLVNSSINPPVSTFSGLTNINTASLVPVSIPSFLWNSSSTLSSIAFTHSSSATPLTSTCSSVASSSLLHTTYSLVPVNCLSTSQIFTTTVTPTLHSFINSPGSATGSSSPTYLFLPQTQASRASVVQCFSMLPPGSTFPLSVSQSLPTLQSVQPLRVLNQTAISHQNQPTIVMLTNTQSTYQVLLNETAFFKLSDNHASHLAIMQKPSGLMESTITEVSPETSAGNSSSSDPSSTLPSNQQTLEDQSLAVLSSPLASLQKLDSDSTLRSSSSCEQHQQIPVVDSVVDSCCDNNMQQTEKAQETQETKRDAVISEETKLTPFASEENEPEGNLSALETSDKESEEVSAVIGQQDFGLSQWQPKVSVFRLPLTVPSSGHPLPSFRLLPGETEDEIYLEEMSEDSESDADDVSGGREDFTKPLSSPDSPVTLEILSCSVCASPGTSIICSACGRGYHRDCHIPPVGPDFWSEWVCSICQDLSDPSDPYSTERFQRSSLSLQSQRRCESLVLYLKVEVCSRCSEFGGLSHLKLISDRLILRRPPPYQTAAQLVSDMWALFKDASQDDELNKLQESFQKKLVETLSSVLHPSLLTAPTANPQPAAGCADSSQHSREQECESPKVEEDTDLIPGSKLKEFRKRLRDFLDLKGSPGSKRAKREDE